jgi:sortase A
LDSPIVPVKPKPVIVEDKTYQTWEVADNEVGWHTLSAPPGQVGNTVLAGHSNLKARVFRHLHRINIGDEITVFAGERAYRYIVTQKFQVQEAGMPPEVRRQNGQWIAPTEDERLTLVTCIRPGATHRLIVVARPVQA